MKVTLDKEIRIKFDGPFGFKQALSIIQEDLTHENPNTRGYANRQSYPKNYQNKVYSYTTLPNKNIISIPRGSGDTLRKIIKAMNIKLTKDDLVDNTTKGYKISFKHKFNSRDKLQETAINSYINMKRKNLIICGSCGFG